MSLRLCGWIGVVALLACGSDPTGGPGDGGADAGTPDANDPTPITARPSRDTHRCQVTRGRTDHAPRTWHQSPALVTTSGGTTFLARLESMRTDFLQPLEVKLQVGSFAADGTFGPTVALPAGDPGEMSAPAAARRGDGFALVWVQSKVLRFAAFGPDGALVVPARDVTTGLDTLANLRIAAGADGGFGITYSSDVGEGFRDVRLVVLDAAGEKKAAPLRLGPAAAPQVRYVSPGQAIVATAAGYALAWRDTSDQQGGIDFAAVDAAGTVTVPRRRVSPPNAPEVAIGVPAGFDPVSTALLPVPGGFLVGWTEVRGRDTDAWSVVKLARLDPSGVRQGAPVLLRAPTPGIDEVEPLLTRFGDAVAVSWARGSHIYVCGGCIPDHRIDVMLIDPADLSPLSNVVSIDNGGGARAGGLLRRELAVVGSTLLATYQLTFHVHATPGSAAFTCQP